MVFVPVLELQQKYLKKKDVLHWAICGSQLIVILTPMTF